MKRLVPLALSLLGLAPAAVATLPQPVALLRLPALHASEVVHLRALGVDIATEHPTAWGDLDVLATPAERRQLEQLGYSGYTLIDDVQAHFDAQVNADGEMGAYHTYDELLAELDQAVLDHSEILRVYDLGPTWETLHKGQDRRIWAVKITDQPEVEEPDEPALLFIGNTHAREVLTVEIPLELIHDLTDAYGTDPQITEWVDSREIWVVPMLNPDGHHTVAENNAMWRKNRNRNGAFLAWKWGVDLNRNWSYQWGYDEIGSSSWKFMETYRGVAPLSEPEAQAMVPLVEENDFALCISYHSYGDLFLYTWSYRRADTPDHALFQALGEEATRFNGYLAGNPKSGAIYTANGEWDDFMYGERGGGKAKTFSFTAEVGSSFWPNESQIPALVDENRYAQRLFIELADYPWAVLGNEMSVSGVPEQAAPGDTVTIEVSVTNTLAADQSLDLWASAEVESANVRQPLAPVQSFVLAPGETNDRVIPIIVPASAPAGDYDLVVEVGAYPGGHVGQIMKRITVP